MKTPKITQFIRLKNLRFRSWTFHNRLVVFVLVFTLLPLILYAYFSLRFFRQNIIHSSEMELTHIAKSLILLCEAQEALDRLKRESAHPPVPDAVTKASPSWKEGNEYKSLKSIIKGIHVAKTGFAYVIDRTGLLVIHPDREGENLFQSQSEKDAAYLTNMRDKALGLPLGVIETLRYDSVSNKRSESFPRRRIKSFGYFKPYDWIVVVGAWEDELIAPYYQGRKIFFVLLVSVTVIVGFSVFLFSRYMMKPLVQLTEAATRIAHGEFHTVKPLGSKDEMGQLTGEFNLMVLKLQEDRIQQLTEWNKELEKKVLERTEELQNACSQMVAIEKMVSLGKISAMVAHELNNPMSGILSYSKYCEKIVKGDRINGDQKGDLGECLEMISREAERCGNIVNNLLVFSKKSYGEYTQSSLSQIVERSVRVIDHSLKVHEIVLEKEFGEGDDLIWCDPSGLEQMLIALIINAVEAMEKGGKIRIQTDCSREPDITIQISDTGKGIPAEILPRIFEPFFSSKNSKVSAGLGLSVVYGIVQSHGGNITVKSKVGEGTAFTILLPRIPSEKPDVEASMRQEIYAKRI